jgi:predicted transcriptional regulator
MLGTRKITVNITDEDLDRLTKLADDQDITATAALRKAIRTECFIQDEIRAGSIVLIEKAGITKQVVFH